MKFVLAVCFAMALSTHAHAEWTATEFLAFYNSGDATTRKWMEITLGGVVSGLSYANTLFGIKVGKQLYCQPPTLDLTGSQLLHMLRENLTARVGEALGDSPIALTMYIVMATTFPCAADGLTRP